MLWELNWITNRSATGEWALQMMILHFQILQARLLVKKHRGAPVDILDQDDHPNPSRLQARVDFNLV